ncbi:MAG: HAMP domain-containing histidine kinase [Notoacmeibacter sp.]|nr:HAMP domain-containing histidine kinase [Notoacmeibacter sp.]
MAGLSRAFDRLVRKSVTGASERARQARLLGVIAAAPFFATATMVPLVHAALAPAILFATISIMFAVAFALAAGVALTGRPGVFLSAGLFALSGAIMVAVAASGGPAGPLAVLVAVPAFEAWWIARSRGALRWGLLLTAAMLVAQPVLSSFSLIGSIGPSSWLALVPITWMATVGARVWMQFQDRAETSGELPDGQIQSCLEAVVLQFAPDGEVLEASPKASGLLDLDPGLLIGAGFFDRIHVADRVGFLNAIANMRDGAERDEVEIRLRLPAERGSGGFHGHEPFVLQFGNGGEGRIVGFLARNDKVARLRDELDRYEEEAEKADLAKNSFLASVSHELRTPLNAIIGFADILSNEMFGGFQDVRQKEYVDLIAQSGQHLLSVVNAILDVSKIESGTYAIHQEPFDLNEAVAMPVSIAEPQARAKSIAIEKRIDGDLADVVADRRAIQQILINLLSNAVKFTPNGGKVTVGARSSGGRVTLWVNDSGIGMAEEDLKRIGRPFVQIQNDFTRQYEGTGLGLSLVKGLVALHGGTMAIDSAPGEGTCVTITFPRSTDDPVKFDPRQTDGSNHGTFRKSA